jgi:hypothetical protein
MRLKVVAGSMHDKAGGFGWGVDWTCDNLVRAAVYGCKERQPSEVTPKEKHPTKAQANILTIPRHRNYRTPVNRMCLNAVWR